MKIIDQEFTYAQLDSILAALGGDGKNGIAFRPFPVTTVLLPLRQFVKEAKEALGTFRDLTTELAQRDQEIQEDMKAEGADAESLEAEREALNAEFQDLLKTRVTVPIRQIPLEALEGREDLSLADLEVLEVFLTDTDKE